MRKYLLLLLLMLCLVGCKKKMEEPNECDLKLWQYYHPVENTKTLNEPNRKLSDEEIDNYCNEHGIDPVIIDRTKGITEADLKRIDGKNDSNSSNDGGIQ